MREMPGRITRLCLGEAWSFRSVMSVCLWGCGCGGWEGVIWMWEELGWLGNGSGLLMHDSCIAAWCCSWDMGRLLRWGMISGWGACTITGVRLKKHASVL